MIDDRIEEGCSEEDAVTQIGSVNAIAAQIAADIPLLKIAKEKLHPKRKLLVWEIVLLVLGSPIWLSLLISAFAVVLSLYASLWAVVISLWAVFASLAAVAPCGVALGAGYACFGKPTVGLVLIGVGLVCAGLAVFAFFGCVAATKGSARLAKVTLRSTKRSFIEKEVA